MAITDEPMYIDPAGLCAIRVAGAVDAGACPLEARLALYGTPLVSPTSYGFLTPLVSPTGHGFLTPLVSPSGAAGTAKSCGIIPDRDAGPVGAVALPPPGLRLPPAALALPQPPASWLDHSSASSECTVSPLGVQSHAAGTCKPCLYFNSGLCHKGSSCTFCHEPHDRKFLVGVRPSKRTRACLERRARRSAQLRLPASDAAGIPGAAHLHILEV